MLPRPLDTVMVWIVRLDDHLARGFSSPRPSGHLSQQLEGPLARAKVGKVKRGVCRNDPHECDLWEVMPLDDHLGADQDIDMTGFKPLQNVMVTVFPRCRVAIHSFNMSPGKQGSDLLLQALRSDPHPSKLMALALGAIGRRLDPIITVMTLERTIPEMIGQGDTAVGTFEGKAAVRAEDETGKSPSIEKEQALFFFFNILLKSGPHLLREES